MIKKTIALGLVIMAAYIALPYGFGLWNENIGVRGQISFAASAAESPEQTKTAEDIFPSESTPSTSDEQSDSKNDTEAAETTNSEQKQSDNNSEESEIISAPDKITNEDSSVPQAVEAVEAAENSQDGEEVQPKTEEATNSSSEPLAD